MKMNEIIDVIEMLACSQGFYGRLLRGLREMEEYNYEQYLAVVEEFESQNFRDAVDFIMYIEC